MSDRFRTIKISDPRFESDNLRHITVKTNNLKGRGSMCVFAPEGVVAKDLPIAVLLHGVYGSALSWTSQAGAHRTVGRMISEGVIKPMVLVMPSDGLWGDGSAYLPHSGFDFEKWICEDVIDAVKLSIPQAGQSTLNFIGGLSMGGFGALHIGAKYPDIFKAISAHSSITNIEQMSLFVEEPLSSYEQKEKMLGDVAALMINNKDKLPNLRFDCGSSDLLVDYNRQLHQSLIDNDIEHIYEEFEGAHEWPYWEKHLEDSLLFFSANI